MLVSGSARRRAGTAARLGSESGGVLDERPGESESFLEMVGECPDAPRLRRVVAAEEEIHPRLLGVEVVVMGGLTGDEGVDPRLSCPLHLPGRAAGDH